MTNPYYNGPGSAFTPYTGARGEAVQSQFNAVAAAFEMLPDPDELTFNKTGYEHDTGVANVMAITVDGAISALAEGMRFYVRVAADVTGASTLNVNGLGAKPVVRANGVATVAGDIPANSIVELVYDGAMFRIVGGGDVAESAAAQAQAAANSAINAPGTSGTSSTVMTVGTGVKPFSTNQGKAWTPGQTVVIASSASPLNQMTGILTAYDPLTGAASATISQANGAGTFGAWNVALSAISVLSVGTLSTTGLVTGGGPMAVNQTIGVPAADGAATMAGADASSAVTPKGLSDADVPAAFTFAASMTLDFTQNRNPIITLTGDGQLAIPNNLKPGQNGYITVIQDSAGGHKLTFLKPTATTGWRPQGGTAPVSSTAAGAIDLIGYLVLVGGANPIILYSMGKGY